jgi:small subunit ribosomal protein S6
VSDGLSPRDVRAAWSRSSGILALAERLSASVAFRAEATKPIGSREMSENITKYEAFYIVKPDLADEDVQKIADRFKGVVEEQGGSVERAGKWDKRKLAYEVNGFKEGTYILMNFEAGPKVPQELNRLMRISDDVIRHRIFKQEG